MRDSDSKGSGRQANAAAVRLGHTSRMRGNEAIARIAEHITRCADLAPAIARAAAITVTGRPAVLEFMTREELTLSRYFTPTY